MALQLEVISALELTFASLPFALTGGAFCHSATLLSSGAMEKSIVECLGSCG